MWKSQVQDAVHSIARDQLSPTYAFIYVSFGATMRGSIAAEDFFEEPSGEVSIGKNADGDVVQIGLSYPGAARNSAELPFRAVDWGEMRAFVARHAPASDSPVSLRIRFAEEATRRQVVYRASAASRPVSVIIGLDDTGTMTDLVIREVGLAPQ